MSYPTDLDDIARTHHEESQRWFPDVHRDQHTAMVHFALGIAGEVGELVNIIKKINRGSTTLDQVRTELSYEIADVLIYLLALSVECGINIEDARCEKRAILYKRWGNPWMKEKNES